MTLMYQSSKGPKPIDSLPYPYLCNAIEKLQRDGYPGERHDEVLAMIARRDELAAGEVAGRPLPADHQIGANNPPEPILATATGADPFESIRVHIDDLYTEAKNWADGAEVENDAQAAEVDRLIDDIKSAIKLAGEVQDAEIKPLTEQVTAIRERFYPLIGETKKITGTAIRAKAALLAVKTKWGAKQRAIQAAEAERLRAEAFAKAREAVATTKAAPDDLEAAESAEDLIRAAQANLRQAKAVENVKATGFRTVWNVAVTDETAALRAMWNRHRPELVAYALELARRDVREGHRTIEGFAIEAEKVAA